MAQKVDMLIYTAVYVWLKRRNISEKECSESR